VGLSDVHVPGLERLTWVCTLCRDYCCFCLLRTEGLLCTEPGLVAAVVILGEMLVVLALGLMFLWHSLTGGRAGPDS
jgi:hypothetical protein